MSSKRKYEQAIPVDTPHQLKVKRLNSEQKWLWVVILLLSYQSPVRGKLYIDSDIPVTLDDMAWEASIPVENVQHHVEVLGNLKMLSIQDGVYCIGSTEVSAKSTREEGNAEIDVQMTLSNATDEAKTGSESGIPQEELEIAKQMGYTPEEWIKLKATNNN